MSKRVSVLIKVEERHKKLALDWTPSREWFWARTRSNTCPLSHAISEVLKDKYAALVGNFNLKIRTKDGESAGVIPFQDGVQSWIGEWDKYGHFTPIQFHVDLPQEVLK